VDKRRRTANEDDGKSQGWRHKNSKIIEENAGRYERDGNKAWRLTVDANLTGRTGLALDAASSIRIGNRHVVSNPAARHGYVLT
jgi:hypothetical protein